MTIHADQNLLTVTVVDDIDMALANGAPLERRDVFLTPLG